MLPQPLIVRGPAEATRYRNEFISFKGNFPSSNTSRILSTLLYLIGCILTWAGVSYKGNITVLLKGADRYVSSDFKFKLPIKGRKKE
jgi:hypothetical protein